MTVSVLAIITGLVLPQIGDARTGAARAKLNSDVAVLNESVKLYLAEGGSLDGITDARQVIGHLKTKGRVQDAVRHVGAITGQLVDVRLAARDLSSSEAASQKPRAVWNAATQRFGIAYGGSGIAEFYFDDNLAGIPTPEETRKRSNMLYNGDNGWIWATGPSGPASAPAVTAYDIVSPSLAPSPPPTVNPTSSNPNLNASLSALPPPVISPQGGGFEAALFPSTAAISNNGASTASSRLLYMIIHSDSSYTAWAPYTAAVPLAYGDSVLAYNQSTNATKYVDSMEVRQTFARVPKTLPAPILTPPGGTYFYKVFPLAVTIDANGAPSGVFSKLRYRVTSSAGVVGAWTNYVAPVSVKVDETLEARNFGVDTTSYYDSPSVSGIYKSDLKLVDFFAGTVVPKWTDMQGKLNLLSTISNLLPDDVKATFGKPLLGSAANSLDFQRLSINSVPPDTDFKIGSFNYFNGTVMAGTEATSINLHLDFTLTKPGLQYGTANAHISLWSSINTQDGAKSSDYAQLDNPFTDFSFQINGVTYTLQLRFANIAAEEGWTDGTRLYVYEGYHGHADLIARFVSSY